MTKTVALDERPLTARLYLHRIIESGDKMVSVDGGVNGAVFSANDYSRFKYGDAAVAERYGAELAVLVGQKFAQAHQRNDPMIITASAYKALPTAAVAAAGVLYQRGKRAGWNLEMGRIYRENLTHGDYATMSHEEREVVMSRNGIRIDLDTYVGRHVVVVDDIRITGSHERSITHLFEHVPILSLTHLYVVHMDPVLVRQDPSVESRLNGVYCKSSAELAELLACKGGFALNARTAKFLLSRPSDELSALLRMFDDVLLEQLYVGALGDGYDDMAMYRGGYRVLQAEVARRMAAH